MPKQLAPTLNQQIRSLTRTAEALDLSIDATKLAADFILCELEPDTPLYAIETQHHSSGYVYCQDILKRLKALRGAANLEIQRLTREEQELAEAKRKSGIEAEAIIAQGQTTEPPPSVPGATELSGIGPGSPDYMNRARVVPTNGGRVVPMQLIKGELTEVDCGNS